MSGTWRPHAEKICFLVADEEMQSGGAKWLALLKKVGMSSIDDTKLTGMDLRVHEGP